MCLGNFTGYVFSARQPLSIFVAPVTGLDSCLTDGTIVANIDVSFV